jgi:hypothetical protein
LVLSLVTFFAPAKKVTRLQAKAFDLLLWVRREPRSNPFRAAARVHFFCRPKRNEPKKRAFPDEPPATALSGAGIFVLAIPWLDPKTAAIHGGRPSGVLITPRADRTSLRTVARW